jgi:hypothetical protein
MITDAYTKIFEINKVITEKNKIYFKVWTEDIVFTWRWWLTVMLLILPWIIWFKYRKKESSGRLLLVGFFTYVITTIFDAAGVAFGLWVYIITPLPYINSYFMPWDFSLFPVTIMFLLQYKPDSYIFIKALGFSLFCGFIAEPLFVWLNIYHPIKWRYYIGIPIYMVIFLLSYKLSKITSFKEI